MTDARARLDHAIALLQQGDLQQAHDICITILNDKDVHTDVLYLLSIIHVRAKHYTAALEAIDAAIALTNNPTAAALMNRGAILRGMLRFDEALTTYDRALAMQPPTAELLSNRANILYDLKQYDAALAGFDAAITVNPNFTDAFTNKANTLFEMRRYDDAWAANKQALAIDPGFSRAWFGLGTILAERGEYDAAIDHFDEAISAWPQNPDAHFNKALCLLRHGDFEDGWPEFEWRWKKRNFTSQQRDFQQPLWLGDADLIGKTILIHAEQGFGDTIQFARYIPLITAGKIVFEVQKPLERLLKQIPGTTIIAQGDPLPAFDYHCPVMSLPLALGKTDIGGQPYLNASQRIVGDTSKPRIGIVWSGSPTHRNDINRSIPLQDVARIFSDKFQFISLQKNPDSTLAYYPQILDVSELLGDFADTAQIIAGLDLVITVDTSVVHLAGALGKPVWMLTPAVPDWRWFLNRTDSPWYDSLRLYRQARTSDWSDALNAIQGDLNKL